MSVQTLPRPITVDGPIDFLDVFNLDVQISDDRFEAYTPNSPSMGGWTTFTTCHATCECTGTCSCSGTTVCQ